MNRLQPNSWLALGCLVGLQLSGIASAIAAAAPQAQATPLMLGQGMMSGEVTARSVILQTRLTDGQTLNADGDLPGADGVACFEWSDDIRFSKFERTAVQSAVGEHDDIVRSRIVELQPDTQYFYRVRFGRTQLDQLSDAIGSFRTLPGIQGERPVSFIVGSCMNYMKFMHGKAAEASGPVTATEEDKRLGYPVFASMLSLQPDFFVGTGDIVYYDNPMRTAKTLEEMRKCWHEQFRFPRLIGFFQHVPAFWSKDDHDFRYNDADNRSNRTPLPEKGIAVFREQLPIAMMNETEATTYRTLRINRHLQIWLTEGRDYRSPNNQADGPDKSLWGEKQRQWLQETLLASDATWKLIISPTPMIGPDDAYKKDNHADIAGFRHERDAFFQWLDRNGIRNLSIVCGDRHWQYHSIHPSGIHEFACGALNDENSRKGVPPGSKRGSDPEGLVEQRYTSSQPSGGFLFIHAGETLMMRFHDDQGHELYRFEFPDSNPE